MNSIPTLQSRVVREKSKMRPVAQSTIGLLGRTLKINIGLLVGITVWHKTKSVAQKKEKSVYAAGS